MKKNSGLLNKTIAGTLLLFRITVVVKVGNDSSLIQVWTAFSFTIK